jgi:hypothetical protein
MLRGLLIAGLLAVCASLVCVTPGARAQEPAAGALDADALFRTVANLYDLDPQLLEAIAKIESAGNAEAVSPKGAQGLMQLMPATARRFGVDDPFDPVQNALGAARFLDYLRRSMAQASGTSPQLPELLAAYNAGEAAVTRYQGIPPYRETQDYVRSVLLDYLLGDDALRLRRRIARSAPKPAPRTVARKPPDALAQMAEIRRRRLEALQQPLELPPSAQAK